MNSSERTPTGVNDNANTDPITTALGIAKARILNAEGIDGPVVGASSAQNTVPERMDELGKEIKEARENA